MTRHKSELKVRNKIYEVQVSEKSDMNDFLNNFGIYIKILVYVKYYMRG